MTRATMLASLALTSIALVGLPVLAFHRLGLINMACTPTTEAAALERPFLAEGVALIEIPRPAPAADGGSPVADGGINVTLLAAALAESEPRNRVLYVDMDAAELGAFAGVFNDARIKQTCHLATGELYASDGSVLRVVLKMKMAPDADDHVGTYSIIGGTGKFQRATGRGSVFADTASQQPLEMLNLTLDGTISF